MATFETALGPVSGQVWRRLLLASVLSLLLHLALLLGIEVSPAGGGRGGASMLFARLEPAQDSTSAANLAQSVATENAVSSPADKLSQPAAERVETRSKPQPALASSSAASGGIDLPFSRDPTYYPARQLDIYPLPLTQLKLDYPAAAADARADGRLLVLLLIDEFGVVKDASIVEAEPQGYFEEAALAVLRAARFSPAQKQGKPVKSRALLQVKYIYGENQAAVR